MKKKEKKEVLNTSTNGKWIKERSVPPVTDEEIAEILELLIHRGEFVTTVESITAGMISVEDAT